MPGGSLPGIAVLENAFRVKKVRFSPFRRFGRRTIKGPRSGPLKFVVFTPSRAVLFQESIR